MLPIAGGAEQDRELIERLVATGEIPLAAVDRAEQLWRERLQHGVSTPSGETMTLALTDLYHLLRDDRIWRKPERNELLLSNVFEIRSVQLDRRRALGRWQEGNHTITGYAILSSESHLVTLHLVSESEMGRLRRQGNQLWP